MNLIHADTLLYNFKKRYDLVIGNPPFSKLKAKEAAKEAEKEATKEAEKEEEKPAKDKESEK